MAIVRSRLGMQSPFKVNARAPSLRGTRTYVQLADGAEQGQGRPPPYSTQTESRVRTRRGQKVGEVNVAEGCSTLAALSGKH